MLNLMKKFLKPKKVDIRNVDLNGKTEVEKIKSNFIYLCFCTEDNYENYLRIIGKNIKDNIKNKTKYDKFHDETLLINIEKLLNLYIDKMRGIKKEPFPYDKYKFQIYFFDFIHKNINAQKLLLSLSKNERYFKKFLQKLNDIFNNLHDVHFYDTIGCNKLIKILDDFYFSLE
jgi:hypothetical protein